MTRIINVLGPYAKAIVCAIAIGLALIAQEAGIDIGLDIGELWQQILAVVVPTLLVYETPNVDRDA